MTANCDQLRLAICTSHPIQYYAPLFAELARRVKVEVFFAHRATPQDQAGAGFGQPFAWDTDLTAGYAHHFLTNVAKRPGLDHFGGCDTPDIGRKLIDGRFDALLVFGWQFKSALQALFAAKRQGLPVIVRGDSHLETPRSMLKRLAKEAAYPPFLRLYDAACYVGQPSRRYYLHYRYPAAKLFHSPHCIDTAFFAQRSTPEARGRLRAMLCVAPDTKLVLFAGKLLPFKRPLDVVTATAALRAQGMNAAVLVAGSGELDAALRLHAEALQTPLHSLGFQNQTQMPAAYAASDVLMLPSDGRETWGLVCNEALAAGRPLLVSSAVGCAEDLVDKSTGATFSLGDMEGASRALAALLHRPPAPEDLYAASEAHSLSSAAAGIVKAIKAVARPAAK